MNVIEIQDREIYDGYDEWLKAGGLRRNNRDANEYIRERNNYE